MKVEINKTKGVRPSSAVPLLLEQVLPLDQVINPRTTFA